MAELIGEYRECHLCRVLPGISNLIDRLERRDAGVHLLDDVVDIEIVTPAREPRADAAFVRNDVLGQPARPFAWQPMHALMRA